jgi:pimeloyl-ACP methyl ester carboxylesterase
MRKMMFLWTIIVAGILGLVYGFGPYPVPPRYSVRLPDIPDKLSALEKYITVKEASRPVKVDNQARIIWAGDSLKTVTPYVIIYLHGFSASSEEGEPTHRDIARKFGCNLLLTRLAEHGLTTGQPMLGLTADRLWNSALEYYAIGKKLGKKVILMGTSTGGTLALKMAAEFPDIAAVILYSPNIEMNNRKAWLYNKPWGLQIAREVSGGDEVVLKNSEPFYRRYWYDHYRIEALVQLEELLESSMTPETFKRVKQPVLLLYYYKDEHHQDNVVKVESMLEMFDQLGTPAAEKMKQPVPGANDHVITSSSRSQDVSSVEKFTELFMEKILFMKHM